MSDYKRENLIVDALPQAKYVLADKGGDADWSRSTLIKKNITPCIPYRKNRSLQHGYDKSIYKQRYNV